MINNYIEEVKKYWESVKPTGRSNKKMLWFTIYACICKQTPISIEEIGECPSCNKSIHYDINKYPYCNSCGQKIKTIKG